MKVKSKTLFNIKQTMLRAKERSMDNWSQVANGCDFWNINS